MDGLKGERRVVFYFGVEIGIRELRHVHVHAGRTVKTDVCSLHGKFSGAADVYFSVLEPDVRTRTGEQHLFPGDSGKFALVGVNAYILVAHDFHVARLGLQLSMPLGGDEFQVHLVTDAVHEEADLLAHVVNPSSRRGLLRVTLADGVKVPPAREYHLLRRDKADALYAAHQEHSLAAGLAARRAVVIRVGVGSGFPGLDGFNQVVEMPAPKRLAFPAFFIKPFGADL